MSAYSYRAMAEELCREMYCTTGTRGQIEHAERWLEKFASTLPGPDRDAVIEECAIIARRHWIECAGLAGSKTANSIAQEIEALKGQRAATGGGS